MNVLTELCGNVIKMYVKHRFSIIELHPRRSKHQRVLLLSFIRKINAGHVRKFISNPLTFYSLIVLTHIL